MTLELGMFVVDTLSCIAFIMTAYYAFKANYDSAKMSKHASEKDRKIMQFYQQSINEKNREKRIDDMVAYTQAMLSKWCMKTTAFRAMTSGSGKNNGVFIKNIDFKSQKLAEDDVYFDGVNLTFWRCVLNLSTNEDGSEGNNKTFVIKVSRAIEIVRKENANFNAIICLLLTDFNDFTVPREEKMQLFQCFRNTNTIYSSSSAINSIISSLYTNKVVRSNLFQILKYRVPINRDEYDDELKNIIGIISRK